MPLVVVVPAPQDRQIGLRFGVSVQTNRALRPHLRRAREAGEEQFGQPVHDAGVGWSDGTHLSYLTGDQLHPVISGEDAGLSHPGIVVNVEPMSLDLHGDAAAPGRSTGRPYHTPRRAATRHVARVPPSQCLADR